MSIQVNCNDSFCFAGQVFFNIFYIKAVRNWADIREDGHSSNSDNCLGCRNPRHGRHNDVITSPDTKSL